MRSTLLFWRHFGVITLMYLVMAFVFVTVVAQREEDQVTDSVTDRLQSVALVVRGQLPKTEDERTIDQLDPLVDRLGAEIGSRITIIAEDGRVLADSNYDPRTMDNHANRPEIVEARTSGLGNSIRYSRTLDLEMLYVCVGPDREGSESGTDRPSSGLLVRTALSTEEIQAQVSEVQQFLWLFALGIAAFGFVAAWLFSTRALQPINKITDAANSIAKGDYATQIDVHRSQTDWGMVALAFERMQEELRTREHLLRDNSHRLETVLGSMSEGVIAVNRDHRIQFANRAALGLLKMPEQQIEGRSLLELVRLPVVRSAIEEAWESDQPIRCEFETRGNYRRTMMMRTSRIETDQGFRLVIVLHDVTELRQLETMRRDFVANVSHELKTPLASIKAYAETLRLGAINDEKRNLEFVEQIETQAERLHQLIIDLIQLARVESSKTIFDITEVCVASVLDDSSNQFSPLAMSREVNLVADCPEDLRVVADAEGLRTILDNLISNAIRYTQAGGIVTVKCRAESSHAVIEVIDTGIGIAMEHQQRVFERFYRVDKARSSDLGGTGLGLAIVKHMTNSFNGSISLSSKVGRGSTFTVRLPLAHVSTLETTDKSPS